MVRTKTQASKKSRVQKMDSPPPSGLADPNPIPTPPSPAAPAAVKQPDTKEIETKPDSSSSSDKLPLPKEREANQPAITTFFSKSPKAAVKEAPTSTPPVPQPKQKEKGKGKSVDMLDTTVLQKKSTRKSTRDAPACTTTEPQTVHKTVKLTREEKNKGPAHDQAEQVTSIPQPKPEKLMASSFKAAEKVQKRQVETQAKKKKRKSELEDLEAPLPTPSRTRQKRMKQESPPPAKSPTPPSQREEKDTAPLESRPLRRKMWASKSKAKALPSTSELYPFI